MPPRIRILRPPGTIEAAPRLPPSKSLANRQLVLAALAALPIGDLAPGEALDTLLLRRHLRERPREMHCGDGGTTLRFLLAWAAVQDGAEHLVTGSKHLLGRPHAPLVEALRKLGASITETGKGYWVRGRKMAGGTIELNAPVSSQFVSALLLVGACFTQGLRLRWTGQRLSEPYVQMTVACCEQAGIPIQRKGDTYIVEPGIVQPFDTRPPADWSAAAFWYQIAGLAPGSHIRLNGLAPDGLQGDQAIAALLGRHVQTTVEPGIVHLAGLPAPNEAFTANLQDTPDLFQPLAFLMAGLGQPAHFTGLHNLPLKETDRLQAVADTLRHLGCTAQYDHGEFHLSGQITNLHPAPFNPQGDHRMAMALAPLALVCREVTILHPEVVEKSYPGFWGDLRSAAFEI